VILKWGKNGRDQRETPARQPQPRRRATEASNARFNR
jgi:hypothetical protein